MQTLVVLSSPKYNVEVTESLHHGGVKWLVRNGLAATVVDTEQEAIALFNRCIENQSQPDRHGYPYREGAYPHYPGRPYPGADPAGTHTTETTARRALPSGYAIENVGGGCRWATNLNPPVRGVLIHGPTVPTRVEAVALAWDREDSLKGQ